MPLKGIYCTFAKHFNNVTKERTEYVFCEHVIYGNAEHYNCHLGKRPGRMVSLCTGAVPNVVVEEMGRLQHEVDAKKRAKAEVVKNNKFGVAHKRALTFLSIECNKRTKELATCTKPSSIISSKRSVEKAQCTEYWAECFYRDNVPF